MKYEHDSGYKLLTLLMSKKKTYVVKEIMSDVYVNYMEL